VFGSSWAASVEAAPAVVEASFFELFARVTGASGSAALFLDPLGGMIEIQKMFYVKENIINW
jgi:hypothetical protein